MIDERDRLVGHHASPVMRRISSGASPFAGLAAGRAKLPRDGGRGCRPTSASAIRTAQLTPSSVGTGICVAHLARQAGNRAAAEDDDLGLVLFDRAHAVLEQAVAELLLGARDVGDRRVERAHAGQPARQAVFLRAFDVPGAQARRQADDRVAPAEHPGGQDRGLLDADHRDVGELARRGEAGIAERANDRRIAAGGVFRQCVEHGVRGDRRLDAVFDILRAECGGDRDDLGAGRGEATRLGRHRCRSSPR